LATGHGWVGQDETPVLDSLPALIRRRGVGCGDGWERYYFGAREVMVGELMTGTGHGARLEGETASLEGLDISFSDRCRVGCCEYDVVVVVVVGW